MSAIYLVQEHVCGVAAPDRDHPSAADSTAVAASAARRAASSTGRREIPGVDLDAVRPGVAGRLHGADQPDDVQLTIAGKFALRPSMFQEVAIDKGRSFNWTAATPAPGRPFNTSSVRAAVVEVPDIDHQAGVGAAARRRRSTAQSTSGMADQGKASTATSNSRPANLSAIARSRLDAASGSSVHSAPPRNSPALTCRHRAQPRRPRHRRGCAATDPAARRCRMHRWTPHVRDLHRGPTTPSRRRTRSRPASARSRAAPPASRPSSSPPPWSARDPRCASRFRRNRQRPRTRSARRRSAAAVHRTPRRSA